MQLKGDLYRLPAEIHQSNRISSVLKETHDLSSCRDLPDMPLCYPEPGRLLDWAANSSFSCIPALAWGSTCSAALAQSMHSASAQHQPVQHTDSPHKTKQPRSLLKIFSTQENMIKLIVKLAAKSRRKTGRIRKVPFTLLY